jgi:hypothetical protein
MGTNRITIVSKAGLAAELRISRARVSQYAQCGMPIRSDGKLDRERALEWIAESPLSINSAYANKGAALAAQKLRPGHEEPPEPWLQPVHDAENFFDKGLLFGLLWTAGMLATSRRWPRIKLALRLMLFAALKRLRRYRSSILLQICFTKTKSAAMTRRFGQLTLCAVTGIPL